MSSFNHQAWFSPKRMKSDIWVKIQHNISKSVITNKRSPSNFLGFVVTKTSTTKQNLIWISHKDVYMCLYIFSFFCKILYKLSIEYRSSNKKQIEKFQIDC